MDGINLYPNMTIVTEHFQYAVISHGSQPVYILQADAADRETIAAWIDFTVDIRADWADVTKPVYSIMDLSKNDISMTNMANKRVLELAKVNPKLIAHTALVLQRSTFASVIQATASVLNRTQHIFNTKVFDNREDAWLWLVSLMEQDGH